MFNYTAFIKAIVIAFRQSISIIFFNSILFCVSIRFTSLTILAKVIVINLAIFFDNALQAGFFFDDAAVEPIGIISDAVNTGNVALEYAVCVEDAACFFRCSIGDQRRDSGSRISGLEIEIVGLTVDFGPTGLLQLAVLVVLPALLIKRPTVGVLPVCLEIQIGEGQEQFFIPFFIMKFNGIRNIVTHGAGNKPTVEDITIAGKTTFGKRIILARVAIGDFYGVHCTVTTVGVEGNGQLFKLVVHRREINVLMRVEAPAVLRLIIRSPAPRKDVGIVLVLGSARVFVVPIIPCSPILAGVLAFLQDRIIPVEPADMVLVQSPLCIERGIRGDSNSCLVGIGRAGAVSLGVPSGKVIVSSGESIGKQCGRHAGIHSLGAHISLAAVGIKGDDRVLGPLGIERGINIEFHCCPVGISRTFTVSLGIPAGKCITLTSECVGAQNVINTWINAHGLHAARTAVRVKGNGDFVALERPFAVGIHIGVARLGTGGPCIGAVCVVQLCRGDGDPNRRYLRPQKAGTTLCALVGVLFGTGDCGLDKFAGTIAGIDIRATVSRIDAAFNVQHAVHIDGSIGDGTAPLTGRRICHRAYAIL